jgi:hypothetical protein
MLTDHHIRSSIARSHVDELIARADAERMARPGRPTRTAGGLRVATVRLLARGLRVEREIEFDVMRLPKA